MLVRSTVNIFRVRYDTFSRNILRWVLRALTPSGVPSVAIGGPRNRRFWAGGVLVNSPLARFCSLRSPTRRIYIRRLTVFISMYQTLFGMTAKEKRLSLLLTMFAGHANITLGSLANFYIRIQCGVIVVGIYLFPKRLLSAAGLSGGFYNKEKRILSQNDYRIPQGQCGCR